MVYLDNSATTRPFDSVTSLVAEMMGACFFNPSAPYAQALSVEKAMGEARATVARSLGAHAEEIVFTSGGTEGDNLAILGTAGPHARQHHVITSAAEHPAVIRCAEYLESLGQPVTIAGVKSDGQVDIQALLSAITPQTALVSIMHVNNEVGAVNDIEKIAAQVKEINPQTLVHADGVQAYLRVPVNLSKTAIDLYTVSAHKIHGPKGIGALYVKNGVHLSGMQLGGGQERGLRSGTENVPGILGFGAAVAECNRRLPAGVERMHGLKKELVRMLTDHLQDVSLNGPPCEKAAPHIVNISFAGVRAEVLLHALEGDGVLVGMGSACSSRKQKISGVLRAMGVPEKWAAGALRVSLGFETTAEDIQLAAEKMIAHVKTLRRFVRR
jgi:cysteine desulfurase